MTTYEWWNVGTTGRAHLFLRLSYQISECGMAKGPHFLHGKGEAVKCRSCLRLEAQRKKRALAAIDAVKTGAGEVFTREQVKKAIKRHLSSIAGGGLGEDLDSVCDAVKEGKS